MTVDHAGRDAALPPLVAAGPELTPPERARYSRHLLLDGIGEEGQRRLRAASVLVVGAGGLGSPVLSYLAGAGVGHITVVDDDVVDAGNLHRQVIHSEGSLGRPKVESAAAALARLGDLVVVRPVRARVDETTVTGLLEGHDLVIDGSDNFATRYLVSDACEIAGVPLVWGTIDRFRGQVAVFWSAPPRGRGHEAVTLRDLYPEPPAPGTVPSCAEAGVVGALCGQVGSMMAMEAVKLVCGIGRPLLGRLVLVDALLGSARTLIVRRDPTRNPVTRLSPIDSFCAVSGDESEVPEVSPADLAAELGGASPPLLLDVREAGERSLCAVEPSVWIPLGRLEEDVADPTGLLGRALAGSGRPVVAYCKGGARSARAVRILDEAGIADVRSMEGGIDFWRRTVDPGMPAY